MAVRTTLAFLFVAAGATTLAQIEAPRRPPATTAPATAPAAAPRPAQLLPRRHERCSRAPLPHPPHGVHPGQRAPADRPRGPRRAGRRRQPLVPRRLQQRTARQDRFRAPVRALVLQRQREHHHDGFRRRWTTSGANNRNGTTNPDRTNYFQNVPVSALERCCGSSPTAWASPPGPSPGEARRERGVVQNEKRQGENQPYGRCSRS